MELLRDRELVITKIHSWRLATVGETPRTVDYPSRNSHGIQLRLSGETVFTICGKEYPSRKDDVIFLPQGLAYSIRNPAAASCLIVNFCTEKEYDLRPRFLHFVNTSVLRKALTDGCALNHKGTAAARCRRFALAYNIVALVQEAVDADYRTSRQRKLIAPAEEYLASCSGAELARIRVADLAAICSIGETYFRSLFTAVCGETPNARCRRMRIELAASALDSGVTVSEAAREAGFDDASYFTKVFRAVTGSTPTDYARTLT